MKKAVVIGSGIAGLASALRLRAKGIEVEIFEANGYAGGKLHSFESKGFRFDYGPSLFTMPQFIEELFQLFDEDCSKHFQYKSKETSCNYFWEDGTTFSANVDKTKFVQSASATFKEPAVNIEKYLTNSEKKYDLTASLFLEKSLHKASTYLSKDALKGVLNAHTLDLNNNLNDINKRYFKNKKLVQLFNRYATYNGSNPYQTPGIMSLIPQLEMRFGTYYPKGGMHEISQSLYRLAKAKGIKFHFNSKVDSIVHENGKVKGIKAIGVRHDADFVICNMDVFSAYQQILKDAKKPKKVLKQERSSSALIFYWGINHSFRQLDLHNIFFTENYQKEFDHIFKDYSLYEDPTVYVNITSKEDPEHAPEGAENWFVMINTPSNKGQNWEKLKTVGRHNILQKISKLLGTDIAPLISTEKVLDPVKIEQDTLSHEGSLYGTSSNSKFAAFFRHPNFSSSIKNLYFCGGSAHPGGGIPLCLLSAKIVSNLIQNE